MEPYRKAQFHLPESPRKTSSCCGNCATMLIPESPVVADGQPAMFTNLMLGFPVCTARRAALSTGLSGRDKSKLGFPVWTQLSRRTRFF